MLERDIQGPRAKRPRAGLLVSVGQSNEPETVWRRGIKYESACAAPGSSVLHHGPCSPEEIPEGARTGTVSWRPYLLWADYVCTTTPDLAEARAKARQELEAVASFQMERELWTGTYAQAQIDGGDADFPNRWLADKSADELTTAAVTPLQALACLTQYLSEVNGGQEGVIHATPQTVVNWTNENLLYRVGREIRTIARDDLVIPGSGYDGSGPDGTAAQDGAVWAYATDPIQLYLGEVFETGGDTVGIDRTNNKLVARAVQLGMATWEGCRLAAAQIDIDVCGIGGS